MNYKSLSNIYRRGITAAACGGSSRKITNSRPTKPNGIASLQMISPTIDMCPLSTDDQPMRTLKV